MEERLLEMCPELLRLTCLTRQIITAQTKRRAGEKPMSGVRTGASVKELCQE